MTRTRLPAALIALVIVALALCAQTPRPGVKSPGIRIPIANLKPDAIFEVPGNPDWIAVDESVWISNFPKGSVSRRR